MTAPAQLQELLALSDDELLQVLDTDPLAVLSGEAAILPEAPVLLALVREAFEDALGVLDERGLVLRSRP
jgi:hypothetical protein